MDFDRLVLLDLNLRDESFWEYSLVNKFPQTTFVIKSGYLSGENLFSGILKIENGDFNLVNRFLKKNYPHVRFDIFNRNSNLFFYFNSEYILSDIFSKFKCILKWPITLDDSHKKLKLILREADVEGVMSLIESKGCEIVNFSKTQIDFSFDDILTKRQREILVPCLKLGYYEFPKRINLNNLAVKLNLSPSTLCVHLQKIEHKILNLNYPQLFGF